MAEAISTSTSSSPENRPVRDLHSVISDIEGAIAVARGITEAIEELSSGKKNPERRLSGICAISGGLREQLADARLAVMELYDLYFADKKEAGE